MILQRDHLYQKKNSGKAKTNNGDFMGFDKKRHSPKHRLKGFAIPAINEMARWTYRKEPRMNICELSSSYSVANELDNRLVIVRIENLYIVKLTIAFVNTQQFICKIIAYADAVFLPVKRYVVLNTSLHAF